MLSFSNVECNDISPKIETQEQQLFYPPRKPPLTRDTLLSTLEACYWNQSEAARRLGVDRTTIWRNIKNWSLQRV